MSQTTATQKNTSAIERPPVVVVVGHIDHGKSTLLDFIRKSNVVHGEAGGITQHTSAYEVTRTDEKGVVRGITFIDTPGHEAFSLMRIRGTLAADIAILVIAADEGVKPQTLEAIKAIKDAKVPYMVALNKMDKGGANAEKVKKELSEHEVYLEGYGGDVPAVSISAKTGEGVDELLQMILLVSELEHFTGTRDEEASGVVVESNRDPKKGITAVLLIKNGTLKRGMYVAVNNALAPVRRIENFRGEELDQASFSSPVSLVGFDMLPEAGQFFFSFENKKDAERYVEEHTSRKVDTARKQTPNEARARLPIVLKADTVGTLEALLREIEKSKTEFVIPQILESGVGNISESDIKLASGGKDSVILGFNVKVESAAQKFADQLAIPVHVFDVIYKLSDWLKEECARRKPKIEVEETVGKAKIIRIFSTSKNRQVIGGKITEGMLRSGSKFKILRRNFEIGRGTIIELQHNKTRVKEVEQGREFGALVEIKQEVAAQDVLDVYILVQQ